MDHLSFVFSLLLIVSVTTTTFGSAIKANNPNGEELEELRSDPDLRTYPEIAPNRKDLQALLKRLNKLNPGMKNDVEAKLQRQKDLEDQDREKTKRKVDAGALIPGKDLTPDLLKEDVGDVRKVVISIENKSGYSWHSPTIYLFSGKGGNKFFPDPLDNGKGLVYEELYQSESVKEGIAGVLTYYIPDINSTLDVMFSLPYNTTWFFNLWNVQLRRGKNEANCLTYVKGYISLPLPIIQDTWYGRELGHSGIRFDGILVVGSDEASLTIVVKPVE